MQTTHTSISSGLRTFMNGLIDYAGLFPPASLDLPEAFGNFVSYVASADSWMLGRFIIPAKRLPELAELGKETFNHAEKPYRFSVLGRGGSRYAEFMEHFTLDLDDMNQFRGAYPDAVSLDLFEVRIPTPILENRETTKFAEIIDQVASSLHPATPYFEVPLSPDWESKVEWVLDQIMRFNQGREVRAGYKLRCGGVTPELFPTPQQIAFAIHQARVKSVPLKGTAGLHHPVRHFSDEVGTKMYGFLNVFGAGLFAHAYQWDMEQLTSIIEDEDPTHFSFDDSGFSWNGHTIGSQAIETVRETGLRSYGSCSFDEPREDMQGLGLL